MSASKADAMWRCVREELRDCDVLLAGERWPKCVWSAQQASEQGAAAETPTLLGSCFY